LPTKARPKVADGMSFLRQQANGLGVWTTGSRAGSRREDYAHARRSQEETSLGIRPHARRYNE